MRLDWTRVSILFRFVSGVDSHRSRRSYFLLNTFCLLFRVSVIPASLLLKYTVHTWSLKHRMLGSHGCIIDSSNLAVSPLLWLLPGFQILLNFENTALYSRASCIIMRQHFNIPLVQSIVDDWVTIHFREYYVFLLKNEGRYSPFFWIIVVLSLTPNLFQLIVPEHVGHYLFEEFQFLSRWFKA
jgi:hypothetical protein